MTIEFQTDYRGRIVLIDQVCDHCHQPSHPQHPAGVIPGLWRCYRCGSWQGENPQPPRITPTRGEIDGD